jgi:hypothetical protein
MQGNNRSKLFTRLDGQGNKVPGSSVQRQKMPRTGRWVSEDINECCFPYTSLTATVADVTDDSYTLIVLCDAVMKLTFKVVFEEATTDIDDLVSKLNANLSFLGSFSADGADVVLKLKTEVSDAFGCTGTLTYTLATT